MNIVRKNYIDGKEVKRVTSSTFLEVYVNMYDTYYFVSYNEVIAIVRNATKDQIEFPIQIKEDIKKDE